MRDPEADIAAVMPRKRRISRAADRLSMTAKLWSESMPPGAGASGHRSRYTYGDASANCIDITRFPPTTTAEAIVEKVVDLVKQGRLREVADIRDETGLTD